MDFGKRCSLCGQADLPNEVHFCRGAAAMGVAPNGDFTIIRIDADGRLLLSETDWKRMEALIESFVQRILPSMVMPILPGLEFEEKK